MIWICASRSCSNWENDLNSLLSLILLIQHCLTWAFHRTVCSQQCLTLNFSKNCSKLSLPQTFTPFLQQHQLWPSPLCKVKAVSLQWQQNKKWEFGIWWEKRQFLQAMGKNCVWYSKISAGIRGVKKLHSKRLNTEVPVCPEQRIHSKLSTLFCLGAECL